MLSAREVVDRWRSDLALYARRCLHIQDKAGKVHTAELNGPQRLLHAALERQREEEGWVRVVHLKPRRYGSTTYNALRLFWRMHLSADPVWAVMIAQDDVIARACGQMLSRMWELHPPGLRTARVRSNDHEQVFGNGSQVKLLTASTETGKRGDALRHLVATEVAYWPEDHSASLMEQVPDERGTEIVLESTAKGATGAFYERFRTAQQGGNEFRPVFLPWFAVEEYRTEPPAGWQPSHEPPNDLIPSEAEYAQRYELTAAQAYWRHLKIRSKSAGGQDGSLVVAREYPGTPEEAFLAAEVGSYLNPRHVEAARQRMAVHDPAVAEHPRVVGVDPAPAHGASATAVIRRQGPYAYGLERWSGQSPQDQAMRLHHLCVREQVHLLVVEEAEGVGHHIVLHLQRIGIGGGLVVGYRPGERADEPAKHKNRKAQNYARLADWLARPSAVIPDEPFAPGQPTLATELLSVRAKPDEQVLWLEAKGELIRRLGRSPDGADALAATFDSPEPAPVAAPVVHAPVYLGGLRGPPGTDMLPSGPRVGEFL